MLATTIRSTPKVEDFTSLADFQSQTPESFVDAPPVLHLHLASVKALIPRDESAIFPFAAPSDGHANGESESSYEREIDVYVASKYASPDPQRFPH